VSWSVGLRVGVPTSHLYIAPVSPRSGDRTLGRPDSAPGNTQEQLVQARGLPGEVGALG
jgi:hypothetical protein